jgi:hypothetical protein
MQDGGIEIHVVVDNSRNPPSATVPSRQILNAEEGSGDLYWALNSGTQDDLGVAGANLV